VDGVGQRAEHVLERVVPTGQGDVPGRAVVDVGEVLEPLVGEVVRTDHAGVGDAALAPVELAVGPEHGVVGLVVTPSGEVGDE
jgi:hypothetical protein